MDSQRAAFVTEAEDGITDLNNALLALEADPEDDAAMDDVFRVAHTLKGNAAAMGYEDVSSFGHALEDLLDAVRTGERAVTPELMDLLFEGVDAVEAMVTEIADTGEVSTDPTELESRLRAVEKHGTIEPGDDEDVTDDDVDVPSLPEGVADLGANVVYADVRVGESDMPGVDATLVTQALEGRFERFITDPTPDVLEAGEYGDGFDVFIAETDPTAVAEGLSALTPVDAVSVTAVDAAVDEAAPADLEAVNGGVRTDRDDENGTTEDVDPTAAEPVPDDRRADASTDRNEITSIRVDVDQVDELYGLVEQLVTSRIKLRRELESVNVEPDTLDELDKLASSLQDTAMEMRLIPFSQVSDSFPRLVRDVARELDRSVRFEVEGDDVELDRTILTTIRDPLVHVLRNAVDHGIEPPAEREAAGKDPTGEVRLTAQRERDHVIIEVADDGSGLDADHLRDKAVEEGVKTREAVDSMSDDEAYDLVFHPGFSTAEEVTDVSGRGVGMDVVRTTARDLDGSVSVDSEPGTGTTVRFRLPVTVAIVKVMFVDVAGTEYGVPIKSIAEVSRANDIEEVHGDEIVRHEGDLYPVIRLSERLEAGGEPPASVGSEPRKEPPAGTHEATAAPATDGGTVDDASEPSSAGLAAGDDGMLVRIREDTRTVALHCDGVLDQEEVVVKPLDGPLSGTPGLSGTAVLGDGDVVAILDVVSL